MIGQNKGANVAAKGENEAQSEVDYLFYTTSAKVASCCKANSQTEKKPKFWRGGAMI